MRLLVLAAHRDPFSLRCASVGSLHSKMTGFREVGGEGDCNITRRNCRLRCSRAGSCLVEPATGGGRIFD